MKRWEKPRLHPAVEYVILSNEKIQIRGVNDNITFDSHFDILSAFLEAIDGESSLGDIENGLENVDGFEELNDIIEFLTKKGYLVTKTIPGKVDPHIAQIDFLRMQSSRFNPASSDFFNMFPFTEQPLAVVGQGTVFNAACKSLEQANYRITSNPGDLSKYNDYLILACSDFESYDFFLDLNRMAVSQRLTIVFSNLDEHKIKVGPIVIPKETACYECYFQRMKLNVIYSNEFDAYYKNNERKRKMENRIDSPLFSKLFGYFITDRILRYTAGLANSTRLSEIYIYDTLDNSTETFRVLKLPRCPVCGLDWVSRPTKAIRDLV